MGKLRHLAWIGLFGWIVSLGTGCGSDGGSTDAGSRTDGGPGVDGGPPADGGSGTCQPGTSGACVGSLPVDMIWVVDNSHSMREEQESLVQNFPELIRTLTNPPDRDRDGDPDHPPLTDLRIGVVSTDLGVGPEHPVDGCTATGDEGGFITQSRSDRAECAGVQLSEEPWLHYQAGDDAAAVADRFGCLAELGTTGCGAEQQLEVAHRALFDHAAPGGPHDGFLRPDSLVVIAFLTDEDDCSRTDPQLFDTSAGGTDTYGPLPVRCENNPGSLHPPSRYIEAFGSLAFERRGGVLVLAIAGAPRDVAGTLNPEPDADLLCLDYGELLADDRMQTRIVEETDFSGHTTYTVAPACELGGVSVAEPARRIVQVVEPFGQQGRGLVLSICEPDLSPAMDAIARLVGLHLCNLE